MRELSPIRKVYLKQCIVYMPHTPSLINVSIKHILIFISEAYANLDPFPMSLLSKEWRF